MAEFIVSCEGWDDKPMKASTAYAAAHRFGETVIAGQAMDEDEFEVKVVNRETGSITLYTLRAQVTTHWVVTRNKDQDEAG